ncbi:MAG: queuosine precursor transporter [Clostridiales bacterium]|nr:queuosine precursor transporter [Clostridiales bacterium]
MHKREIFCAFFVALLLVSNILVVKIVALGSLILPAAIVVYPFCYILSHVVTEIWGFAYARRMIFLGFAANFMMVAFIYLCLLLPSAPADIWPHREAFEAIFGLVPRVVAASFIAYLFGELLNSLLMSKIKQKWGPRRLFVRTISSTAVGQAFDTGIFITVAFWGAMPNSALLTLMFGQYAAKMLIEMAVGTPMAYALVGYLKRTSDGN